jgi:D-glycero-beta-D-manno-heptose-7-phosphate kinase
MQAINLAQMTALVARFAAQRILVIGDVMLDEFIWGRAERIAPEAPVPVVAVSRESVHLGGAGNVAANVAALGGQVTLLGVCGVDPAADQLRGEMQHRKIDTSGLVSTSLRPTTIKTRIIAHSQQVVRVDRESRQAIDSATETALLAKFFTLLDHQDAVIISDYAKGVITRSLLAAILPAAAERKIPVTVDPKPQNFTAYHPATIITPNHHEAAQAAQIPIYDTASLATAAQQLRQQLGGVKLLITRGEEGMTLFNSDGAGLDIPTTAHEVYDVTGAGDTVIATLTLALASQASDYEAVVLANHAAGIAVSKVGTATVKPAELLQSIKHFLAN